MLGFGIEIFEEKKKRVYRLSLLSSGPPPRPVIDRCLTVSEGRLGQTSIPLTEGRRDSFLLIGGCLGGEPMGLLGTFLFY